MISYERAIEVLNYAPETGLFTWKKSLNRRIKVGAAAGLVNMYGYVAIKIDKKKILAHRLAWLFVNGRLPDKQIDHIDGDRANNRIINLREVSGSQNQRNSGLTSSNTSGYSNICWCKRAKAWKVSMHDQGRPIHIGNFREISEAILARDSAYLRLGYHSNHGARASHSRKKGE